MKTMRVLKKQLEFTGKLVDMFEWSGEILSASLQNTVDENKYPKGMYSAIRVISGEGVLQTKDAETPLSQGALYFIHSRAVKAFHTKKPINLVIYNFTSEKSLIFFQPEQLYRIPYGRQEEQLNQMMLSPERETDLAANSALVALFRLQYYNWIDFYEKKSVVHHPYEKEIRQAAELIESDPGQKINFSDLSRSLNLSERNFRKMFTLIMGMAPKAYQQELRLKTAAAVLKEKERTMAEISEELGYYSQFQFSRDFKKRFGVTPSEYKKQI